VDVETVDNTTVDDTTVDDTTVDVASLGRGALCASANVRAGARAGRRREPGVLPCGMV
jgi:hypothetical protein